MKILLILGGVIGLMVVLLLLGGKVDQPPQGHLGASAGSRNQQPTSEELIDDDPMLGDSNAPITLVEFADYQCTFCSRFFNETEPTLIEKYVKTGKLKIVFRDLVVNGRESQNAAEAAQCAGAQGKYWEYHDRLYRERKGYNVGVFTEKNLKAFAQDLGLNGQEFDQCYDSDTYRSEISRDGSDARRLGATGTPTFFLNGRKLVGAQPIAVFESAIEYEIQKNS